MCKSHMGLGNKGSHRYSLDPEPQHSDFRLASYHPIPSQGCQTTLLGLVGQEDTSFPHQNEPGHRILGKEVQSLTEAAQAPFLTPTPTPNCPIKKSLPQANMWLTPLEELDSSRSLHASESPRDEELRILESTTQGLHRFQSTSVPGERGNSLRELLFSPAVAVTPSGSQ